MKNFIILIILFIVSSWAFLYSYDKSIEAHCKRASQIGRFSELDKKECAHYGYNL